MTSADSEQTTTDEGRRQPEPMKGPPDDRSTGVGVQAPRVFRILITVSAVILFNQSLQAGEFMSGSYEFLEFHRFGATAAEFVVLFAVIAAAVAKFRGPYSWWPVGLTTLLWAAIQMQEVAGEERWLAVHVPLGVSIIVSVVGLTVWAWREPAGRVS